MKTGTEHTGARRSRRLSSLLALILFLSIPLSATAYGEEGGESLIRIGSEEEFYAFAANCHVDTWSVGKTFVLEADLALDTERFLPAATFGGTFDGNGHTISGFSVYGSASETGLFGTIQESGTVRSLSIGGIVRPEGVQNTLGGVAGINRGVIENVSFSGVVEGHNNVGGICGVNEETGTIRDCQVSGSVQGDTNTGGIAGWNKGFVTACRNEAAVNTVYADVPFTTDTLSNSLEQILTTGRFSTLENADVKSDMGGIAGLSSGIVTDCVNAGDIGYEHVGYNIGGICGRSSGYTRACENTGTILGRKDAGGIVGQLVPFMELEFASSVLEKLDTELDTLSGEVDSALDAASGYSTDTQTRLNSISALVDSARGSVKTMTDEAADRADKAAERANTVTASAQSALGEFSGAARDAEDYAKKVLSALDVLEGRLDGYLKNINISPADREALQNGIRQVREGLGGVSDRTKKIIDMLPSDIRFSNLSEVLQMIGEDVKITDPADLTQVRASLQDIRRQYERLAGETEALREGIEAEAASAEEAGDTQRADRIRNSALAEQVRILSDVLADWQGKLSDPENILSRMADDESLNAFTQDLSARDFCRMLIAVEEVQARINPAFVSAVYVTGDGTNTTDCPLHMSLVLLLDDGTIGEEAFAGLESHVLEAKACSDTADNDLAKLLEVLRTLLTSAVQPSVDEIRTTLGKLPADMGSVNAGITGLLEILARYGIKLAGVEDAQIAQALQALNDCVKQTPGAVDRASSAMDSLSALDLSTSGVSETMRSAGSDLYAALDSLQREMNGLNASLDAESQDAITNVRGINTQFGKIVDVLEDAYRRQTQTVENPEDRIDDVSDEDVENAREGRASGCTNRGEVNADSNAGGIAGMIGVELDLDPETDIQSIGNSSMDYVFRARGIIDACRNFGGVGSRNNYCGGIVGHMELGLVTGSADYGMVDSEGDFVGGIAGYSSAKIRSSFAKAEIRGGRYVGGIAGYGSTLFDNAAMVHAGRASQYVGAIAGKAEKLDPSMVARNIFVADGIYGIDGVSYSGMAEAVDYAALSSGENAAAVFGTLVLTFTADDAVVGSVSCGYGESVPAEEIPEVPEKEGFFGEWSRTDFSRVEADAIVEAVYSRAQTLLAALPVREDGLPILFVEGTFREGDEFAAARETAAENEVECFAVTPPADGAFSHVYRFLPGEENTDLYLVRNGQEKRLETGTNGRYRTFTADGDGEFFLSVRRKEMPDLKKYAVPAAAGAGAVLLLGLFMHAHRVRRRRRASRRDAGHGRRER